MTDPMPDAAAINAFNKTVIDEFRANGGKVGGPFVEQNMVLLTTTGAKTGQSRLVPLSYLVIDGKTLLVGSLAGAGVATRYDDLGVTGATLSPPAAASNASGYTRTRPDRHLRHRMTGAQPHNSR